MMIEHFYRAADEQMEVCFNVEVEGELSDSDLKKLIWLLGETFEPQKIGRSSVLRPAGGVSVEIGPRLNFATAWSTNAVAICQACGLTQVRRLERSRIYRLAPGTDPGQFSQRQADRMTECAYPDPLTSFAVGVRPEAVQEIMLREKGPDALKEIPGVAMDEHDRQMYYDYFVVQHRRNPTNVEILDLNNANSEHSRHGYFRGRQVIDGIAMPETLMEIVKSTLKANPANSRLAFCDNSSVIQGARVLAFRPSLPGKCSAFRTGERTYHILFTAETHNFPTGIAPFPGAETGTGGRIRDVEATGRGGLVIAGTTGYCVGNLYLPGYVLPWEDPRLVHPETLATPQQIEIGASDGASNYGNEFGEPVIQGFTRSFDLRLPNGERRGFLKPILFTGGIGQTDEAHLQKHEAEVGMLILEIGGPAYRIGFGGGAASSLMQGENKAALDFNAVQRGDGEMEKKMDRVVRACVEMGEDNPIVSIHDQGAGGPANVLKELVEKSGGRVELRRINVGDPTLSVLEIWVCEYQERNGLLIRPERLAEFLEICWREKVKCEVLGEVTGDGRFVVHDEADDSTPVDLELDRLLGNMPQKEFRDTRTDDKLSPLALPEDLELRKALERVFRLVSVGSKRFLTNKVDRSVTGLIVQQPCCGPLQLTVADVAVVAQSHFGLTGAATAIGEQPIKMLVDPKAGARMAVGEMLTNLMWSRISALESVKCSANWMWAPKLPGEGAKLYDAAVAMRDLMIALGIAVDGGKDSLSMATKVTDPETGKTEIVKSPGQLVISGYADVPDVTQLVTPDLKSDSSHLCFIDLSGGKNRLGGSALAQVYGQIGDESPDVEDPELLKRAFGAVQDLIGRGVILAGHDRSDGGLITTLLEMAFAGMRGLRLELSGSDAAIPTFFSEELGVVVECSEENLEDLRATLERFRLPWTELGMTRASNRIEIFYNGRKVLDGTLSELRSLWEETSYQLERRQKDPHSADEEKANIERRSGMMYRWRDFPLSNPTPESWLTASVKPKVAIIREEGSNGDREMAAAFWAAGLEPWDVTMTDLEHGKVTLRDFRGVVFVGGFSYADVLDSAKGWAGVIRYNPRLRQEFDDFYTRPDTFSLGVCNGCQLMALLGWVPWRGIADELQPRFIRNRSEKFESRWSAVKIKASPAILLKGMEEMVLGVWVAHGEGRLHLPERGMLQQIRQNDLAPVRYVDDKWAVTDDYPFNPNGSPQGIAGLCSPDGRHLAMMPHPERAFLLWQWAWLPEELRLNKVNGTSPWLRMFQNARAWCDQNR